MPCSADIRCSTGAARRRRRRGRDRIGRRPARYPHAAGLAFEDASDRRQQAAHGKRLLDEIGGAEPGRRDRVLDVAVAGDHDDADFGPLGLDAAQKLDAVDIGHPDVEQDQRRVFARDKLHHPGRVAGVEHPKALVAQDSAER